MKEKLKAIIQKQFTKEEVITLMIIITALGLSTLIGAVVLDHVRQFNKYFRALSILGLALFDTSITFYIGWRAGK